MPKLPVGKPLRALPKPDPARQKAWQKLLAELRAAKRDEAGGFDHYWETVGVILSRNLWADGRYDSAEAFARDELGMPLRSAERNVRVAKYASPDEEVKYGAAKLDAALMLIDARTHGSVKGKLPVTFEKLRVPLADGSATNLERASVAQIRAAARVLRRGTGTDRARHSPVEQAFVAAVKKQKELVGVGVHFADGALSFSRVPATHLDVFLRVARSVDWRSALRKEQPVVPTKKKK